MKQKQWTDTPPDVHEGIRRTRRFLRFLAWRLSDDEFMSDDMASAVLATYCDNEADWLDSLLAAYELPSDALPHLLYDETGPERLERLLSRNRRKRK